MLVVGAQEEADETVSVRSRFAGDEGIKPLGAFVDQICKEIRTREIRKIEVTEENAKQSKLRNLKECRFCDENYESDN